jgi:hypothetical protein
VKFRFITQVDEPVNSYGGVQVSTGDIVELDGPLADKASRNPNYEVVKPGRPKKAKLDPVTDDGSTDES